MESSVPRIKIKLKLGGEKSHHPKEEVDDVVVSDDGYDLPLEKVPKRYRDVFNSLWEEEKKLLGKYSKAKKVLLKVVPSLQRGSHVSDKALAKAALEQQQRRSVGVGSKDEGDAESLQKEVEQGEIVERRPKIKRPRLIAPASKLEPNSSQDRRGYLLNGDWNSQNQSEALLVGLPNLSFTDLGEPGKSGNTLIVWATMPVESKRFCFNLCPSSSYKEADRNTEIWYHFNPRDGWGRRHVIQNSYRNGSWDKGADKSISGLPFAKGKKFEFRLHLSEAGFCLFIDNRLQTEYFHRFGGGTIAPNQTLYLIIPTVEERYGDRENVVVHSIWWGHTDRDPNLLVRDDQDKLQGKLRMPKKRPKPKATQPKASYQYEENVLYVAGLPRDGTAKEELIRLFTHYGMARDEKGEYNVKAIDHQGYGFVTLESAQNVADAIQYLDGQPGRVEGTLKVTRARKPSKTR